MKQSLSRNACIHYIVVKLSEGSSCKNESDAMFTEVLCCILAGYNHWVIKLIYLPESSLGIPV